MWSLFPSMLSQIAHSRHSTYGWFFAFIYSITLEMYLFCLAVAVLLFRPFSSKLKKGTKKNFVECSFSAHIRSKKIQNSKKLFNFGSRQKKQTQCCAIWSVSQKNIIKGKRDDEEHLMTHQSIPYDDKKNSRSTKHLICQCMHIAANCIV
jgi:hypothetical protein